MRRRAIPIVLAVSMSLGPVVVESQAAAATSRYQAVRPARVLDTRAGIGAPRRALAGHGTLTTRIAGRGRVAEFGVTAVRLTVSVHPALADGSVVVFPAGRSRAGQPVLRFRHGHADSRTIMVRLGRGGSVSFANSSGRPVQIAADTAGYYRATVHSAAVRNLRTMAAATTVKLSWTNPGPRGLVTHVVRRSVGARPPATPTSGTAVARPAAGRTSYVDSGLKPHTRYSYAVFAVYDGQQPTSSDSVIETPDSAGVSGTVTGPSGDPVPGVRVLLWYPDDVEIGPRVSATTGADGRYVAGGLVPGFPYVVCFDASASPGSATGYQRQCWRHRSWDGGRDRPAQPVTVTVRTPHVESGYDVQLAAGGAISGRATDADGDPVAGVSVYATPGFGNDSAKQRVAVDTTDANGGYRLTGLSPETTASAPGYRVGFLNRLDPGVQYRQLYYPNAPLADDDGDAPHARAVEVRAGKVTAGVSVRMLRGAEIAGRVVDAAGRPIRGAIVEASQDHAVTRARTDGNGIYRVGGLRNAAVSLCTDTDALSSADAPDGYLDVCRSGIRASTTPVGSGPTFTLGDAAAIAGTVVSAVDGMPVPNSRITLGERTVGTDAQGGYRLAGLGARDAGWTIYVSSDAADVYAPGGFEYSHRSAITTRIGSTTRVDVTLQPAAALSGRVLTDDGRPIGGAFITLWLRQGGYLTTTGDDRTSGADGSWAVPQLRAGGYWVCVSLTPNSAVPSQSGYLPRCVGGSATYVGAGPTSDATLIELTAGQARSGTDIPLAPAAGFTGTITAHGRPLAGVGVQIVGENVPRYSGIVATTDDDGHFTARNLPPYADVGVCFSAPAGDFVDRCWSGRPGPGGGQGNASSGSDRFDLQTGHVILGIDEDLTPP